jgi:nitrate/TMAO reductase-like tetraheme cytochrome c subunit
MLVRYSVEKRTWQIWMFNALVVPGFLFLLHSYTAQALYIASAVVFFVAVWNLSRKQRMTESALLIVSALYATSTTILKGYETLLPLGYAAGALALVSLSLSWHRRLQEVIPSLSAAFVMTLIPVALSFPWIEYSALLSFLALTFFSYTLSGSLLLGRERTMPGLVIGHIHVAFGDIIAIVALAYAAFKGFPLSLVNALTALFMAAVALLAGLRVNRIIIKFRWHFFYTAGLFLTFSFLTVLWHVNPLGSTSANLSLVVLLIFLLYGVGVWYRSRLDQVGYTTLLEVPAIPAAVSGTMLILGMQPGFSTDLFLPIGLMLPGALFYWRLKRPQMLAAPIVGLSVLILALLTAYGASFTIASLVYLTIGAGMAAWEIRSMGRGGSYVRLFALGAATLASIGLSYPWHTPTVYIAAAWPVVYLFTASSMRGKNRQAVRVGLEAIGYGLMLLTATVLVIHTLFLEAVIVAAIYALTFFVMTARSRKSAYLYPATAFTVLAAFLVALIVGQGGWYLLWAFPLTVIFYAVGVLNLRLTSTPDPLPELELGDERGNQSESKSPLYFGGHLNAAVGAIAFLLFADRLDDVIAFAGVALHLAIYVWMAYRKHERGFLLGAGLSLCLLLVISLSFLPFVERTNLIGYFMPTILLLLGYGWLLRKKGDAPGSQAILSAVSVVTLISGGVALWTDGLSPASVWITLVVGSLVWLGLLVLTRLDIYIYLITASLSLLGFSFLREVSDSFVSHVFIFLVYGCLLIALVFAFDLLSRRMKFRMPIHFGHKILRREWLIYGLPVLALVGVGLIGFGVESTSSPPFCGLCHTMGPYYASWENSPHGQAGVSCADCHYEPNARSYIRNKIVGLSELVKTATDTEGYLPMGVVSDLSCLRGGCHVTAAIENEPILYQDQVYFTHKPHLKQTLRGVDTRCTLCHTMTQLEEHMSINEEACLLCHFKGRQDRPTAIGGCLDCHETIRSHLTEDGFSHDGLMSSRDSSVCTGCHKGVTIGDGEIKEECSFCHLQDIQELLRGEPADIHRLHVSDEGVRCSWCHEDVLHGVQAPMPAEDETASAAPAQPSQSAEGEPPKTPDDHTDREQCLMCHTSGAGGAPVVPQTSPNHADFKDDDQASLCWSCHS